MNELTNSLLNFANRHFNDFKIRNGEIVVKECPFCKGGQNGDIDTFAIGLYNGAYSCLRGSCNKRGGIRELFEMYGETAPVEITEIGGSRFYKKQEKHYILPNVEILQPITDEIMKYFALRKISEETLQAFKISADINGNIIFPFFKNGILTYLKYRKPKKIIDKKVDGPKEWGEKNTEPILFGMDNVSFNKPLYITEGEIDALSLYEAGISNVVSVPCGCSNLEWINLCWDWLEHFNQIIIFGDNDEPGLEMANNIIKRLGEDRCMMPKEYPNLVVNGEDKGRSCKDANEILYCYGTETLKEIANSCEPTPIKGIINFSSIQYVDPSTIPRIYTRIPELDNMIGGFEEGTLNILSGKRGQGKSTIGGSFILNAIDQNIPCCIYSGELSANNVFEWICLQATESKYIEAKTDIRTGKIFGVVPIEIQNRIRQWADNKLFLFDNGYTDDCSQQDAIIKVFTLCAKRYGCKMFLTDNIMSALITSDEENRAQAKFASELKAFANKFKATVILVCHPRKFRAGDVMTNDDVSGASANFLAPYTVMYKKNVVNL